MARAAPDGYTLLIGGAANTINATLYKNFANDLNRDLVPMAMIGVLPNMMVVPKTVPARNAREFVAWAKTQPGGVSYGSSGQGATTHLAGELFKMVTGTPMTHIPYRGSAPALTDLIAGRTVVMFDNMTSALQQVKAGHLSALAIAGKTRNPALPDVPTLKELGIEVEAETWFSLFLPAATPRAIVERLNREVRQIVQQPDMKTKLGEFGLELRDMGLPELRQFTDTEVAKWAKVIEVSGVKAE